MTFQMHSKAALINKVAKEHSLSRMTPLFSFAGLMASTTKCTARQIQDLHDPKMTACTIDVRTIRVTGNATASQTSAMQLTNKDRQTVDIVLIKYAESKTMGPFSGNASRVSNTPMTMLSTHAVTEASMRLIKNFKAGTRAMQ